MIEEGFTLLNRIYLRLWQPHKKEPFFVWISLVLFFWHPSVGSATVNHSKGSPRLMDVFDKCGVFSVFLVNNKANHTAHMLIVTNSRAFRSTQFNHDNHGGGGGVKPNHVDLILISLRVIFSEVTNAHTLMLMTTQIIRCRCRAHANRSFTYL